MANRVYTDLCRPTSNTTTDANGGQLLESADSPQDECTPL